MRRIAGFTLYELLITLAIASILLAAGVPAMSGLVRAWRASAASSELTAALAYGRMSAVSRNRGVTLCPSDDGLHCSNRLDWSGGWIVFTGSGADTQPTAPDALIARHDALGPSLSVMASTGRPRLHFLPSGFASGTNVTLSVCDRSGRLAKVVMNNAGRARVERVADACPST